MNIPAFFVSTLLVFSFLLSACNSKTISSGTGRNLNKVFDDRYNLNFKQSPSASGLILIEGGSFTQGLVENNIMNEWNYKPTQQHVMSFFMDETEVTNLMYLEYITWLEKVFPSSNPIYKLIHEGALPDTLVWKSPLGYFDELTLTYFRHPAYADYPVVGVNWLQAVQYAEWRTDRINESILIDEGYLNEDLNDQPVSERAFNTSAFLKAPEALFDSENDSLLAPFTDVDIDNPLDLLPRLESGLFKPTFRLPTESEWEYAALGKTRKKTNTSRLGKTKFPWASQRHNQKSPRLMANFKLREGNYGSGPGKVTDRDIITNKVKSYPPNDYGLYDMQGNVAEWVLDIYRPIVDNEESDLNYYRGNNFQKEVIGPDGKIQLVSLDRFRVDTLPNGRPIVQSLPGEIEYANFDDAETFMRTNIDNPSPIAHNDGDVESSIFYRYGEEIQYYDADPMYNSPRHIQITLDQDGELIREYDPSNYRTTLISNQSRVYKGGSWKDRAYWLDPAKRRLLPQYLSTNYIGFRCAMSQIGQNSKSRSIFRRNSR
ncbi:MAG: gliding motility lipoprotein GldJ [Flavobacteriaceae bacterium]|nr:gliding motility lipoprotein GldJ [Flavobacteriaceae bacterium]